MLVLEEVLVLDVAPCCAASRAITLPCWLTSTGWQVLSGSRCLLWLGWDAYRGLVSATRGRACTVPGTGAVVCSASPLPDPPPCRRASCRT